ncbi:MAG TPA: hypothetical protein ENH86_01575 [Candidatus Jorgensenbacteria bacterium]|nr:hypothetical protein [Candidatus Jorgensenbacteria bacterium]
MLYSMRNKRKIAAFVILLAGLAASVFIITPQKSKVDERNASVVAARANDNPSFQFESGDLRPKTAKVSITPELNEESSDNLTELLTLSFTNSLLESGGEVILSEEGVTQALQEATARPLDYPQFTTKDVVVSLDDSIENQIAYIKSLDTLLWEHFSEFEGENTVTALDAFFQEGDSRLLDSLINTIPAYLDDLLELETPGIWKELHVQVLNLWQEKLAIYQGVLSFKSDPAKTYVSLQLLPIAIQKEQDIQSIMNQFYEELLAEL